MSSSDAAMSLAVAFAPLSEKRAGPLAEQGEGEAGAGRRREIPRRNPALSTRWGGEGEGA